MNTDNPQFYKALLARIISLNVFFVLLMVSAAFLAMLGCDYYLWQSCAKTDILKVFIQNARFNLSVSGYFNIPVFAFLLFLLVFKPAHIKKSAVNFIKSYYLAAFIAVASLLTLSYLLSNISDIERLLSEDYFSKLSFIYAGFNNPTFMVMLIFMSALFLATVIFFLLLLKFTLASKEYAIDDHNGAFIFTALILLVCILFAKGKIIGHLSVRDAVVTPVVQLNEYAVRGPYKILHEAKNFDFSQIVIDKERRMPARAEFSDEEIKEREGLYRFTPKAR